ncbi:hypothetical protein EUTSA_v10000404mg [Eutrema salsugineum]|uniref:Uncharacterized protein n=1 Tax=Eutrema salsugineum TaxID=72664 RepID=V4LUF5_EUTSA|nr:hypothetical protein EUTSA_v10000404mg [Eutrema salsugineum]
MEWEKEGLRLSLALGNASLLKCAASALTATVLSSLLELFAQASLSTSLCFPNFKSCFLSPINTFLSIHGRNEQPFSDKSYIRK